MAPGPEQRENGFAGELVAAEGPSAQGTNPAGHLWARGGLGLLLALAHLPISIVSLGEFKDRVRERPKRVQGEDVDPTALDTRSGERVLVLCILSDS